MRRNGITATGTCGQRRGPSHRKKSNAALALLAGLMVLFILPLNALAATKHGPDAILSTLSAAPSAHLTPGSTLSESFTEMNIGDRHAGRTIAKAPPFARPLVVGIAAA